MDEEKKKLRVRHALILLWMEEGKIKDAGEFERKLQELCNELYGDSCIQYIEYLKSIKYNIYPKPKPENEKWAKEVWDFLGEEIKPIEREFAKTKKAKKGTFFKISLFILCVAVLFAFLSVFKSSEQKQQYLSQKKSMNTLTTKGNSIGEENPNLSQEKGTGKGSFQEEYNSIRELFSDYQKNNDNFPDNNAKKYWENNKEKFKKKAKEDICSAEQGKFKEACNNTCFNFPKGGDSIIYPSRNLIKIPKAKDYTEKYNAWQECKFITGKKEDFKKYLEDNFLNQQKNPKSNGKQNSIKVSEAHNDKKEKALIYWMLAQINKEEYEKDFNCWMYILACGNDLKIEDRNGYEKFKEMIDKLEQDNKNTNGNE